MDNENMKQEDIKSKCMAIYESNLKTKFKLVRYAFKNDPELLQYLKNKYGHNLKLSEYIYQGIHDTETNCKHGNKLKFKNMYDGYGFCSISCQCKKEHQSDKIKEVWVNVSDDEKSKRHEKLKATVIEKYGVENIMHLDSMKDKIKQTNFEKYGSEHYSQTDEYKNKIKETSLEKYGVKHHTQNDAIKNKIKKTTTEKYGGMMTHARKKSEELFGGNVFGSEWFKENCETLYEKSLGVSHPMHSDSIKESMKQKSLEKYGVEYPMQLDKIKDKLKQTNLERYGVENPMQLDEFKDKIKQTNIERYGVENYAQTDDCKDKVKATNIEKYGVEYYSQTDKYLEEVKKSNMEKYGVEYYTQTDKYLEDVKKSNLEKYGVEYHNRKHFNKDHLDVFDNPSTLKELLYEHGTYKLAKLINCDVSSIYKYASDNNIQLPPRPNSYPEELIHEFLNTNNIPHSMNNRKILPSGLELDFYIPEYNLAIEINGLYYHSEMSGGKTRSYHHNKWKECNDLGITLLSINEDEFYNRHQFWLNKILYMTGRLSVSKLHARKCKIKELTNVKNFLNDHHLQGSCHSSYKFGLFYEDQLVSVMTFSKPRSNESGTIDLSRFCNHSGYLISGGASKLLSHFIKTYGHLYNEIISFSDNNYSNGNVYKSLGFSLDKNLPPDYKYIIKGKTCHKSGFRKSSIFNKHDIPDHMKDSPEWELMQYLGYDRIWDTGKKKWIMKI
jgi:hypothetical protein